MNRAKCIRPVSAVIAVGAIMACSLLPSGPQPIDEVSAIVAATLGAATDTASTEDSQASPVGIAVSFAGGQLVIPEGLASGSTAETVPAVTDQNGGPWGIAPTFVRVTLHGYVLQGKFFEPQIMIYPAQEYAAVNNGAAISIPRLQAILASPSAPMTNDVLPRLPWANAEQVIGAAPKVIAFKNGTGVRALAEYAQYFAPINNHDFFYHFEGFTDDGEFYVLATLPINCGFLPPESDPSSVVPPGGVPFPGYDSTDPVAFSNYYQAIADLLEATSSEEFQPTLTELDTMIGSVEVSP